MKRPHKLMVDGDDTHVLWVALDQMEGQYRQSLYDMKRGRKPKFCNDARRAERAIKYCVNLKRRVMNLHCKIPRAAASDPFGCLTWLDSRQRKSEPAA